MNPDKQLPADPSRSQPTIEWCHFGWLPCTLSLELPLAPFTIRDLLRLKLGSILVTQWSSGSEVPLRADGQMIGWAELEPAGEHIGARVTELS